VFKKVFFTFILIPIVAIGLFSINYFYNLNKIGISPFGLKFQTDSTALLLKSQTISKGYFDGIPIIEKITPTLNCTLTSRCIEIKNTQDNDVGGVNKDVVVPIVGPFMLKVTMRNENGGGVVSLIGALPEPSTAPWWQDRITLDMVALFDGKSPESVKILSEKIELNDSGFLSVQLIFDTHGKKLILTDRLGYLIKSIDINKETGDRFPDGLFPYGGLNLGLNIAPNAKLFISEFYGVPIL